MSMFDALKNLNLGDMMKKAREVQEQMKTIQQELAQKQITADAGGGMVQATVNGAMELIKLKIDKTRIDPSDTDMLEDVIVAAVHAAQVRAGQTLREEMQKRTADLGLPPGMLP